MTDHPEGAGRRRWFLFGFSVLFGLATAVVLVLSVSGLRDRVGFERVIRRIDQLVRAERFDQEYRDAIEDAAEYARTRGQFLRLLDHAWNLDDEARWSTIVSVTTLARNRHDQDRDFLQIESYARIRNGDRATAATLIEGMEDGLSLRLRILAAIDLDQPDETVGRFTSLGADENAPELFQTLSRAFHQPGPADLFAAWEAFGSRAFAVNGALSAAVAGDREATRRSTTPLRASFDPEHPRPTLYLAAWLDDDQWLFSQLRSLEGRRVVEPELFLLQADGHVRQGQYPEAQAIYREIIATAPESSPIPFINLAVINERYSPGPVDQLYREALQLHPQSRRLRLAWATRLIRRGDRLEAARVVAPIAVTERDDETWLLARAVLGVRRPVARLESDLWEYINRYPEATDVAAFLARFLLLRNDREGLTVLESRYQPETAAWARILHAQAKMEQGEWRNAEELLAVGDSLEITYNRAVFALKHRDQNEYDRAISAYRADFERDVRITGTRRNRAEVLSLLLEAEAARLKEEPDTAIGYLDRAELLGYPSASVTRYRALLAGAQ